MQPSLGLTTTANCFGRIPYRLSSNAQSDETANPKAGAPRCLLQRPHTARTRVVQLQSANPLRLASLTDHSMFEKGRQSGDLQPNFCPQI